MTSNGENMAHTNAYFTEFVRPFSSKYKDAGRYKFILFIFIQI